MRELMLHHSRSVAAKSEKDLVRTAIGAAFIPTIITSGSELKRLNFAPVFVTFTCMATVMYAMDKWTAYRYRRRHGQA